MTEHPFQKLLEPSSFDLGHDRDEMIALSTAVSLKRIADSLTYFPAGRNLFDVIDEIARRGSE